MSRLWGHGLKRPWLVGVLVAGLTLGVAACGGNGEDPTPTPTSDESTSAEATTEPSVDVATPPDLDQPVPPVEAGVDDRAGAAAAVAYYFALLDYATTTGDVRELKARSGSECQSCATTIAAIEANAEAGGWVEGSGPTTLSDVVVAFPDSGEPSYFVGFHIIIPGGTQYNGDGTSTEFEMTDEPSAGALAQWTGSGFIINGIDFSAGD